MKKVSILKLLTRISCFDFSTRGKALQNIAIFALSFFIILSIGNSFAQEPGPIDINGSYESTNNKMTVATGERANVAKTSTNVMEGNLAGLVVETVPQSYLKAYATTDPNKVYGKSLLEGTVETTVYAMESQPTVNVTYALAQDWVPGYTEKSSGSVFAGDGYTYLKDSGIADLWNISRNIAYIMFIVIIIAAGFMIMFRNKIGGQMAVTVYSTLPNVILGLILVTFSFPIVGLILNISGLLTMLAHGVLGINSGEGFYSGDLGSAFQYVLTGVGGTQLAVGAGSGVAGGIMGYFGVGLTTGVAGVTLASVMGSILSILGGVGIIVLILVLVLVLAYIGAFVSLYITLLKAYLGLLADTVLGPIILAFSVFPGNDKMMVGWFNRIIRNALIFPAVFFITNAAFSLVQTVQIDMSGLVNGTIDSSGSATLATGMLDIFKYFLPLASLFFANNIGKVLEEIFPSQGSQGLTAALQGTQAGFTKIPLVGGLFAGGGK